MNGLRIQREIILIMYLSTRIIVIISDLPKTYQRPSNVSGGSSSEYDEVWELGTIADEEDGCVIETPSPSSHPRF